MTQCDECGVKGPAVKDHGNGVTLCSVCLFDVLYDDSVKGLGPCARCGHDPACGWSRINDAWLCHTDTHSCYEEAL